MFSGRSGDLPILGGFGMVGRTLRVDLGWEEADKCRNLVEEVFGGEILGRNGLEG